MSERFKLYFDGSVHIMDDRPCKATSFAHVVDLHLPAPSKQNWPTRYRQAIEWWNTAMAQPDKILPEILDEICDANVDFVFFGGDNLDYYNLESARHILKLCRERGLRAYFQLGNHDSESLEQRFITHQYDHRTNSANAKRLCDLWAMPNLYYSFTLGGVRFLALNMIYQQTADGWSAHIDDQQIAWFFQQINFDGPLVIFCHYPFNRPTLEHRLRALWNGHLACIAEDANGRSLLNKIKSSSNILALFAGHAHIGSEDNIGDSWQFITTAAHSGKWRHVRIDSKPPPKSFRVPGLPCVSPS